MKEMKIVKNYKRLKKWEKTLFVSLLTICILFTSTGVATLFVYADPADENSETNEQFNTENGNEVIPSTVPEEHEHVYVTTYESNHDGTHKVIQICECGDSNVTQDDCIFDDGKCICGYIDTSNEINQSRELDAESTNDQNTDDIYNSQSLLSAPSLRSSSNDEDFSAFFTVEPRAEDATYDGTEHQLFYEGTAKSVPFDYDDYSITGMNITYTYSDGQNGTDAKSYRMTVKVVIDFYVDPITLPGSHTPSRPRPVHQTHEKEYYAEISPANIANLGSSISPSSPMNFSTYKSGTKFSINGLTEGVDFDSDYSNIPDIVEADNDYTVTITGKGNYTGNLSAVVHVNEIAVKYNGQNLHAAPYDEQVEITGDGYKLSYSETGPFDSTIIYTEPGDNQSITLYFQDNNGYVIKKTIQGLNVKTSIPIKFNGSTEKKDSYSEKVDITADGYTISTSNSGPFSSKYTHNIVGENQVIQLYFRSDQTGTVKSKTITGITILPKDVTAIGESTGKIIVGDYSSDKIAATENTVYMTSDAKSIEIQATNDSAGIKSIEYATANEAYNTVSDILGAVIDKKMNWKPYSSDGKPTLPKDSALYIYARITDQQDNYNYLSTGKIIYDTVDPIITNAILAAKENGSNDNVLAVTAKDTLSGIKEFYMLYEEKNSDSEVPKKSKIIEDGKKFRVDTNDGQNAGGSYKLSDLNEDKTYIFYIVAKDEVGNISEIKTIESKGKGSNSFKGSGSSSNPGNSKSGNGLAPAPNGIAGSGNTKTPKTGTTNIPQKTDQEEKISPLEKEINRVPYISDATGDTKIGIDATGGWDKITNEVKNSSPGISMDVEMSGFSVVPDKVFTQMKGKDLNVKFLLPEKVQWIINGQNIESTSGTDLDMGVRIGAKNIPNDMLTPVVGSYPHTEIELKHNGTFGFSGILRIPLGESNAGLYAYLYYYDTKEKEMKFMQSTQISSTGYAEFSFNHASDYTIVIRSEEMMTAQAVKTDKTLDGTNTYDDNTSAYKTFKLTDFAGSRASVRMWLFMIAIISAVMCGLILYMPGLKDEEA